MKIIHTSDWHIGREFEGEPLAPYQREFVEWLCGVITEHSIDLVIVAGDIYDKAMPKGDAVTLLDESLNAIRSAGAELVLISGNHDNAARLNFGAQRQRHSGVFIFAQDETYPEPFLYEARGEQVIIVPIPFLDPQRAPQPLPRDDGSLRARTHQHVLEDAITVARARLGDFPALPTIAVAHAYVQGSEISDSERHNIGGADVVDASIFRDFTYTALGHLHRPQTISGAGTIAYSGTPLPYSFSEEHLKSVRLLEINADGIVTTETIPIPVGRHVKVLTDTFDQLLAAPQYEPFVNHWISVKLTDEGVIEDPMTRLRVRYPHIAALAYAEIRRTGASGPSESMAAIESFAPYDTVIAFIEDMQGRDATDVEQSLTRLGLESVTKDEA